MKPETHVFQVGRSRLSVQLAELPNAVHVTMTLTGPPLRKPRHVKAFAEWFAPIVAPFDRDGRPLLIRNKNTHESAIVV